MKIVEQKWSLSEDDLGLLVGDPILTELLKNRIIIHFDTAPDLDELEISCNNFYHIRSMGTKIFQFWFADPTDYENFRQHAIGYKMSLDNSDK